MKKYYTIRDERNPEMEDAIGAFPTRKKLINRTYSGIYWNSKPHGGMNVIMKNGKADKEATLTKIYKLKIVEHEGQPPNGWGK